MEPIQEAETPARSAGAPSEAAPQGPQLVIWGTDVNVTECKDKFKTFILTYTDPEAEEDERMEGMNSDEPLYLQKLDEVSFHLLGI